VRVRFWMLRRVSERRDGGVMAWKGGNLSSMTSLRTFIIATAWSSVKPSSLSRRTNFSVSKWWSLDWIAVALNARRMNRLCIMVEAGCAFNVGLFVDAGIFRGA